jgi:FMN phosphatase YigB (HAD superfamily)
MLIILDFDGVLVDSVVEHALVSYSLITDRTIEDARDLPAAFLERFRQNRCHVVHAGDLVALARWACEVAPDEPNLTIETARHALHMEHEVAAAREREFFAKRAEIVERGREQWFALNPPFPEVWSAVRLTPYRTVILTTKNRVAVLDIAENYGLPLLAEDVYAGDGRTTKSENIERIQRRFPSEEALFVDDVLSNLEEVRDAWRGPQRLRLALASWGYTSDHHMTEAKRKGIEVVSRNQLIEILSPSVTADEPRSIVHSERELKQANQKA